jgi:hypothetical protein
MIKDRKFAFAPADATAVGFDPALANSLVSPLEAENRIRPEELSQLLVDVWKVLAELQARMTFGQSPAQAGRQTVGDEAIDGLEDAEVSRAQA